MISFSVWCVPLRQVKFYVPCTLVVVILWVLILTAMWVRLFRDCTTDGIFVSKHGFAVGQYVNKSLLGEGIKVCKSGVVM